MDLTNDETTLERVPSTQSSAASAPSEPDHPASASPRLTSFQVFILSFLALSLVFLTLLVVSTWKQWGQTSSSDTDKIATLTRERDEAKAKAEKAEKKARDTTPGVAIDHTKVETSGIFSELLNKPEAEFLAEYHLRGHKPSVYTGTLATTGGADPATAAASFVPSALYDTLMPVDRARLDELGITRDEFLPVHASTLHLIKERDRLLASLRKAGLKAKLDQDRIRVKVNETFTLTNGGTVGMGALSHSWNMGDGTVVDTETVTHQYPDAGIYLVTYQVEDPDGNKDLALCRVEVYEPTPPPPALKAVARADKTTVKVGEDVSFESVSVSATSHEWYFGDRSPPLTGESVAYAYPAAGTYKVTLLVRDRTGGIDRDDSLVIKVEDLTPPTVVLSITATASKTDIKVGEEVEFKPSVSGGKVPLTYVWDFGDGSTGNSATINHKFSTAGDFTVKITVKDSATPVSSAEGTVIIKVTP